MLAGGVAAVLGFHGAHDDGVKKRIGAKGGAARGFKVGAAGCLARVGHQDDDPAAPGRVAPQGFGSQVDRVIQRRAVSRQDAFEGRLQRGHAGSKRGQLRDRIGKFKQRQAVAGTHQFLNETRSGVLLKFEFLHFAQARIDHQGDVQRLLGFRLEDFDFLLLALLRKLQIDPR